MTVLVYSTPTCPFFSKTKIFLDNHAIVYRDRNVQEDEMAAKEMIQKSGQMGVPVIEINGEIVVGFDQKKIKKLLHINV